MNTHTLHLKETKPLEVIDEDVTVVSSFWSFGCSQATGRLPVQVHPVEFTTGARVQECLCKGATDGEAASPLCCGGSSDDAALPLLPLLPLLAHFLSLSYTSGSSSPLKSSFPPFPPTLLSFVLRFFLSPSLAVVSSIPLFFICSFSAAFSILAACVKFIAFFCVLCSWEISLYPYILDFAGHRAGLSPPTS